MLSRWLTSRRKLTDIEKRLSSLEEEGFFDPRVSALRLEIENLRAEVKSFNPDPKHKTLSWIGIGFGFIATVGLILLWLSIDPSQSKASVVGAAVPAYLVLSQTFGILGLGRQGQAMLGILCFVVLITWARLSIPA